MNCALPSVSPSLVSIVAVAGLVVLLTACATNKSTTGRPIDDSKISQIVKGKTTQEQIIELFGMPQTTSEMNGNPVLTYSYSQTKGSTAYMPYHTSGKSDTTSDELTIIIDKATDTVKTYSLQRGIAKN